MTIFELVSALSEIVEKNPEVGATAEVMLRKGGNMEFEPVILLEPKAEDDEGNGE